MHVLAFARPREIKWKNQCNTKSRGTIRWLLYPTKTVVRPDAFCWWISFSNASKNEIVGNGRYNWSDGSSYDGGVIGGLRSGHGTFTSADGTLVINKSF